MSCVDQLYKIIGIVDPSCESFRGIDSEFLPYSFSIHISARTKNKAILTFLRHYPDLTFSRIVCSHVGSVVTNKSIDYLPKSEIDHIVDPYVNPSIFD